ncbi:MAG TPA: alpha/beta fold hydrolase [Rhizomicrobium sp.]|jgi:alpha-beta hydrolase superfamily lysophospholipase|nr:alpha/beta fold hydrolase [Rhizomicrobium sp.]
MAGCAAETPPLGNQNVMPHFEDGFLVARDGMKLPLREWDADSGAPAAVIIALHGMSDYSNAFDMPATAWAKRGITTLAIDQRGFGRSPNPGLWAGGDAMRSDLNDFAIAAHARFPATKIFALGESMGGAVVLSDLATPFPPAVDGAILVSPAVWSRADMPALYRVALFMVAHVTPGIILSNNAAGRVVKIAPSDNVPMLIALGKDPLFQKETRADTLYGLVNLMGEARAAPERLPARTPPILYLHGGKDQIIPPEPAKATMAALGPRADTREYDSGYHMLLRDLGRAKVQDDTAAWVLAHAPPTLRSSS